MLDPATAFDVCQDPITPEPHEVRSLQAAEPRPLPLVSPTQTLIAGVAVPTENASRIIAIVQLDDGFPLELEVAMPKVGI